MWSGASAPYMKGLGFHPLNGSPGAGRPDRRVPHLDGHRSSPAHALCRDGGLADDQAVDGDARAGAHQNAISDLELTGGHRVHARIRVGLIPALDDLGGVGRI